MVGRKLFFGELQRKLLLEGILELEQAVGSTLGPKGKTVLIHKGVHPIITKDGVTVAREIYFSNNIKNVGVQVIKDAAIKTNIVAGDGTTTSTILACQMIQKGFRAISMGCNSTDLKKGMLLAKEFFLNTLPSFKTIVKDEKDVEAIAMISSNNDKEIASVVKKAFTSIGDYGIVEIVDSFNSKTTVKISEGTELDKGMLSSYFINRKDNTCELDNPKVLISASAIEDSSSLMALLQWASKTKEPLVIIAPDFSESFVSLFAQNVDKKSLQGCLIKTPGWNKQTIEDTTSDLIALFNTPCAFKDTEVLDSTVFPEKLGVVEHFKAYSNRCIFSGAKPVEAILNLYSKKISDQLDEWEKNDDPSVGHSQAEKERLKKRIARLIGGVATIYVGGDTEVELIERKHRFEDAVNSVKAALAEGIVPGGGTTYINISDQMNQADMEFSNNDIKEGWNIVRDVLIEPLKRICKNSGVSYDEINCLRTHFSSGDKTKSPAEWGYDSSEGKLVKDMVANGIVDPLKVAEQAFINAFSVASTLLTTDCSMVDENSNIKVIPNDPLIDEYNYAMGVE